MGGGRRGGEDPRREHGADDSEEDSEEQKLHQSAAFARELGYEVCPASKTEVRPASWAV